MQEIRLAAEREITITRQQMQRAAFVGWQVRDVVLAAVGSKTRPNFTQYLTSMGLSDAPTNPKRVTGLLPKGTGANVAARVREAFRRKPTAETA